MDREFGDHTFATAVELAKVALTSIVTSCSGLLIGLFAYAGQRTDLPAAADFHLLWGVSLSATGLILAILAALLGYLSELAYHNRGNNAPWWFPAFACALLAVVMLASAMVHGGLMLTGRP